MTRTEQISRQIIEDRGEYIEDEQDVKWYLSELDLSETDFDLCFSALCEHFGFVQ